MLLQLHTTRNCSETNDSSPTNLCITLSARRLWWYTDDVLSVIPVCVFQGSNLRTAVGTGPTVGMVLRLVSNEVCRASALSFLGPGQTNPIQPLWLM